MALDGIGNDLRQRGFAGAGRPVKDDGGQPVGVEHAAEEFARTQEMVLANEFVEVLGAHANSQRRDALQVLLAGCGEEVHGLSILS